MQLKPDTPRPPTSDEVAFDLEAVLGSVVALRAHIPEDAMTASVLGTERAGHGVVINDSGLVLTIGYLVTEADSVWLVDNANTTVPAYVVAYDQETGFGLVQALQRLPVAGLPLGSSDTLSEGDYVVFAGHGGVSQAVAAEVVLKREFAGYWEYLLEEAIFTAPAHPNWGGAAVIGRDGTLRGIGSLLVQHVRGDEETFNANMVVPVDLLKPILDELLAYGRRNKPSRPWLGMMTTEYEGHLVVAGVTNGGPRRAGGGRSGRRRPRGEWRRRIGARDDVPARLAARGCRGLRAAHHLPQRCDARDRDRVGEPGPAPQAPGHALILAVHPLGSDGIDSAGIAALDARGGQQRFPPPLPDRGSTALTPYPARRRSRSGTSPGSGNRVPGPPRPPR